MLRDLNYVSISALFAPSVKILQSEFLTICRYLGPMLNLLMCGIPKGPELLMPWRCLLVLLSFLMLLIRIKSSFFIKFLISIKKGSWNMMSLSLCLLMLWKLLSRSTSSSPRVLMILLLNNTLINFSQIKLS